jgi:hypothetical protein
MGYDPVAVLYEDLTCSRCGRVFDLTSTTGTVTICNTCANYIFIVCTLGLTPVMHSTREVTVWSSLYSR